MAISCSPEGKLATIQRPGRAVEVVGDPVDENVIARVLPNKRVGVILSNSMETPYRCIGGFMYLLQRLGYIRNGFISDPLSAQP